MIEIFKADVEKQRENKDSFPKNLLTWGYKNNSSNKILHIVKINFFSISPEPKNENRLTINNLSLLTNLSRLN